MPARLILNADDFGLTPGINRAIVELHCAGALTSATLMATGPAFDDAVRLARTLPALGVGCHVVLVDGAPASHPSDIPTLLGPDRRSFRPTLATFVRDLFLHRIDHDEIAREALAQVQKLQRAGIDVTHVDTHKHTHCLPAVARSLFEALQRAARPAVRLPFEPHWSVGPSTPLLRRAQLALLSRYEAPFHALLPPEVRTTDGTLGIAATGTLTSPALARLLSALPPDGTFELCCHPGYRDDALDALPTRLRTSRQVELQALLTEIPKLPALPIAPTLIHYGNL